MLKWLPFVTFFLAVPWIASAQVKGALVEQDYDSLKNQKNLVTLHIRNVSQKQITAYNIKIKETYGTAVNEHEYMIDTVGVMMNVREMAGSEEGRILQQGPSGPTGALEPGAMRDEPIYVGPGLIKMEATVDTVIYADKTGETTNRAGFDRIIEHRKAEALTMQSANKIIRQAVENNQDSRPAETAMKQIEALRQNWKASNYPSTLSAGELEEAIRQLKVVPTNANRQYLNDYMDRKDRRAAELLEHANIKLGGAQ